MMTIVVLFILMGLTWVKLMVQGVYLTHKMQQLGYHNMKFIKWLDGKQFREVLMWNIFELLAALLLILLFYFTISQSGAYKYIVTVIMFVTFAWKIIHPFISGWVGPIARKKNKKNLVYTQRVIRLLITHGIVSGIILGFVFVYSIFPIDDFTYSTWQFFRLNAFLLFVSVVSPAILILSNVINIPVEGLVHRFYFVKARGRLKKAGLVNIGITGSFGKTSTKFFLSTLLQQHFKTLHTPSSYNTPMGISKVLNGETLTDYEYFVCEMGADHNGEIAGLCKLVKIKYGILTSIGPQHLETFGSVENIIKTKFAILTNLPADGFGVYNYDSELIRENVNKFNIAAPLYAYSMEEKDFSKVEVYSDNVRYTRKGLEFTVHFKNGDTFDVSANLLGRHNVLNLTAAILTAKMLGLSQDEIRRGLAAIEPVEHRLQLIDSGSGILVIDDAFNSNLAGATEALNVLREIEGGQKIIITPGFIDLGAKEDEHNEIFGQRIAEKADIAIIVGLERTKKIQDGIRSRNFPEDNLFVVESLNAATQILSKTAKIGDVVLFENDLPDIFSEKN